MGMLDLEFLYEIPCLKRIYLKNVEDGREFDFINHRKYAGNEDCMLDPGRIGFEGNIWGEWEHPVDHSVHRVKWPHIPDFMHRETIDLTVSDLVRAERFHECVSIQLLDEYDEDHHVFYDSIDNIWKPEFEGLVSPTMKVKAFWINDDTMETEVTEWFGPNWKPAWAKETKNERD